SLKETVYEQSNHQYPSYTGMMDFRASVADWYQSKAGINLDPASQVITLIGAKEGIAHMPYAFIDPGDVVLVPDPAYPVYNNGTVMAGGTPVAMPLLEENGFLPDLSLIDPKAADAAKIMWLNYPGNPTAATATTEFFEEVIRFAEKHNIVVCHDGAYTEVTFDGYRAPSFLEVDGAVDVGVEFHSLSKTYNMTGWRIGWAAGNAEVIDGLGKVKTNIDSGAFQPLQFAGIEALEGNQSCVAEQNAIYQQRRDLLVDALNSMGLSVDLPKAACYVWCKVPDGYTSGDFTALLIEKIGVVTTPGDGFGPCGQGYIRMTLTVETDRLSEAVDRMRTLSF
ncbi:MAG: LL-diaminopimelate aminotransferase, partial [Candidatus Latescibacteria bacterium]|nr:LL-diaminopimelate aminotransferase [Candidatus Latescibacterota bacterium]